LGADDVNLKVARGSDRWANVVFWAQNCAVKTNVLNEFPVSSCHANLSS